MQTEPNAPSGFQWEHDKNNPDRLVITNQLVDAMCHDREHAERMEGIFIGLAIGIIAAFLLGAICANLD